ncbi:MAG: hypothetical protein R3B72_07180 [Polyangiaceae bacterium]
MGCSAHVPAVPLPVADTAPREPSVADEEMLSPLPQRMGFDWRAPGLVAVSEFISKAGKEVELAYELHLCPDGERIRVRQDGHRIVTIMGIPGDDQRLAGAAEKMQPLFAASPVVVVGGDGLVVEVVGADAQLDLAVPEGAIEPGKRVMLALAKPRLAKMMEDRFTSIWNAWVGAWLPFNPRGEAVQRLTSARDDELWGVEVERVGRDGPRLHLRLEQHEQGGDFQEAEELIRGHLRALGMGDALDLFVDATFQRNTRWEVVTEPATSRLRQARTWREIVVTFADGSTEALVEEHRYQFDWQAGQGRAPGCDGEPQEGAEAK